MMKSSRVAALILVVGAVLSLLTGCTASQDIVLTFDGETCRYEGPDVVTEGEVTITLVNETDFEASLWMVKLDEGRTWQELLDYIGPPGTSVEPPPWSSGNFLASKLPDNPDATVYKLNEGLYGICCCTCNELFKENKGVWPGAAFEVRAK